MIVTFSLKYRNYMRKIRGRQIEKVRTKLDHPSALKEKRPTDPNRFIKEERCTQEGEVAEHTLYSLDEDRIGQEEKYDGFYAVCTNLEDDAEEIAKIKPSEMADRRMLPYHET